MSEPRNEPRTDPEQQENPWLFNKKLPLGLMFAMLVQAGVVMSYIRDIKQDVELLKSQNLMQRDRDERQDKAWSADVSQLRQQLEKMDMKLDRLVERGQR